jgi:hypothetical protein
VQSGVLSEIRWWNHYSSEVTELLSYLDARGNAPREKAQAKQSAHTH